MVFYNYKWLFFNIYLIFFNINNDFFDNSLEYYNLDKYSYFRSNLNIDFYSSNDSNKSQEILIENRNLSQ